MLDFRIEPSSILFGIRLSRMYENKKKITKKSIKHLGIGFIECVYFEMETTVPYVKSHKLKMFVAVSINIGLTVSSSGRLTVARYPVSGMVTVECTGKYTLLRRNTSLK